MYKAVLWDFGGVITSSPFEAFNRYEKENNLPENFIRKVNSTNPDTNAWALLESNQISLEEFDKHFADEALELGEKLQGAEVLALLSGNIRPEMVQTLKKIKTKYQVACITNNVIPNDEQKSQNEKSKVIAEVFSIFDTVIESSKVGIRKPQPQIYQIACSALGIEPHEAIFLDDLGINLKPAKAMGMTTIKVIEAKPAIAELAKLLEMDLP